MNKFLLLSALFISLSTGCKNLMELDFRGAANDAAFALTPREENTELTAIRKKYYRTWSKEMRRAVNDREVLVGMDKYQVQVSTRIEEFIVQRQLSSSKDGPVEIWTLWKTSSGWAFTKVEPSRPFTIRFVNGKVAELRPL